MVDNPKKEIALAAARLETEPACISSGVATGEQVQSFSGSQKGDGDSDKAVSILRGIQKFFGAQDNCDESFIFAHYNDTLAGVYIGSQLGKGTAESSVQGLIDRYSKQPLPSQTVAEFCRANGTKPEHVFGIVVESARDLASVQDTVRGWSLGNCVDRKKLTSAGALSGATVLEVSNADNSTFSRNFTLAHHRRSLHGTTHWSGLYSFGKEHNAHLNKRATCSSLTVADGDTCPSLVKKCGISSPSFVKYNPKTNLCSTLKIGDFVCCSAGNLPSAGVSSPKPGADGVCATHLIQNGDTCSALATKYGVTVDDIEKWNKGKTWAWTACKDMLLGYNLCVSDGFAPMPPSQQGVNMTIHHIRL